MRKKSTNRITTASESFSFSICFTLKVDRTYALTVLGSFSAVLWSKYGATVEKEERVGFGKNVVAVLQRQGESLTLHPFLPLVMR